MEKKHFEFLNEVLMDPVENEAEEIYQRLCGKKSVLGVMVFGENSVRSSLDGIGTTEVSSAVFPLVDTARRTVRDLDPTDELVFLRIRTRRGETIVGTDEGNVYVVLQDARFIRTPQIPK